MQTKKLIIFDFDGTLANVDDVMIAIYQKLSSEFHLPQITEEEIPNIKNLGAKQFIKERLHISFWRLPRVIHRALEEYQRHSEEIALYPGIAELLSELRKKNIATGIVSSNKSQTIQSILHRYNINVDFVIQSSLFGKARVLRKTVKSLDLRFNQVVYVGDEIRDVEAAKKAGLDIISVTWGLNTLEALQKVNTLLAHTPKDILTLLSLESS